MPIYAIDDLIPVVDPTAFIHPTAVLIGDVIIGAECYIGASAVLRGDFGRIAVHSGSNVQDGCVLHSIIDYDCIVEQDCVVGHGAVLHACRIGRGSLVGMQAVVLDFAEIGESSLISAAAFVRAAFQCPPMSFVAGNPAVVRRVIEEREIGPLREAAGIYRELARRCLLSHRETTPLAAEQENRPRAAGRPPGPRRR